MTAPARRPLRIRVEGTNLPGLVFGDHRHVHVAVQCRKEPVGFVPGDADEATFEFDVEILPLDDGPWDFFGPHIQGRRGERFVYLSWCNLPPGGEPEMFRRAKLHLSCLAPDLISAAARPGHSLVARLSLTDGRGTPRCASLRPPALAWSAEPS